MRREEKRREALTAAQRTEAEGGAEEAGGRTLGVAVKVAWGASLETGTTRGAWSLPRAASPGRCWLSSRDEEPEEARR
jgi:hypothetical protein